MLTALDARRVRWTPHSSGTFRRSDEHMNVSGGYAAFHGHAGGSYVLVHYIRVTLAGSRRDEEEAENTL